MLQRGLRPALVPAIANCPNNRLDQTIFFPQKEVVKSIGNPAGIGQGTGLGLRERERDGIGLGHYRLRATKNLPKQ